MLDLYKSLVVLWIVNTVNELIHLISFTKTLSTYPSVLKLFQNVKIWTVEIQDTYQATAGIHHYSDF